MEKDLEKNLKEYALDGKRDGYKNFAAFQKMQKLDKIIAEKFGIGD